MPLEQSVKNVGIDFVCVALFLKLWSIDEEAKQKQMARIGREERLSGMKIELSNGKIVLMCELRGFARVVVFAGNEEYCRKSLDIAERFKEELLSKGVLVVPVPMDDKAASNFPRPDDSKPNERKFRASAVNAGQKNGWRDWVNEQKTVANIDKDVGVFVGLRLDGRVRSSGKGIPPFDRFAAELPPVDSWSGMLDGFDGKVGIDN